MALADRPCYFLYVRHGGFGPRVELLECANILHKALIRVLSAARQLISNLHLVVGEKEFLLESCSEVRH